MAKAIKCYVCKHPNRKKIDEALKAGMGQTEVWHSLCPDIKKHSIQRHYAMDHHLHEPGADWTPATIGTTRTKRTSKAKPTRRAKRVESDVIKVHWELPRTLVKKLKHRAIDEEIPTVELVRAMIERGL
jgi:hypothetical protein